MPKTLGETPATLKAKTISQKAKLQEPRSLVPLKDYIDVICFNYSKTRHYSLAYIKPRKLDIKEIKEPFNQEKEQNALLYNNNKPGNKDSQRKQPPLQEEYTLFNRLI